MVYDLLTLFSASALLMVFGWSAAHKTRDFAGFVSHIMTLAPIQNPLACILTVMLVGAELLVCVLLIVGKHFWAFWIILLLLLSFTGLYIHLMANKRKVKCMCFSNVDIKIGIHSVYRNLILIFLGLALLIQPARPNLIGIEILPTVVFGVAVGLLLVRLDEIVGVNHEYDH